MSTPRRTLGGAGRFDKTPGMFQLAERVPPAAGPIPPRVTTDPPPQPRVWRSSRVALYAAFIGILAGLGGYGIGYMRAVGDMGGGYVELPIVGTREVPAR